MDMLKNEKYQVYASYAVKDIPTENLKIFISDFIEHAALNMGAKVERVEVDRVIENIQLPEFSFAPLSVIASAFIRGSLGKLKNEKVTLNPRNIYDWVSEVTLDYRHKIEHDDRAARLSSNTLHFKDLERCPLGKAICKKIEWGLTEEEWDKVPLKELAVRIGNGHWPTPQEFGIEK